LFGARDFRELLVEFEFRRVFCLTMYVDFWSKFYKRVYSSFGCQKQSNWTPVFLAFLAFE
jgi:hypothetical protein